MRSPISVLIIENSPDDAELIADALRQRGLRPAVQRIETEDELRDALSSSCWDLILLDYVLAGLTGLKALQICREIVPDAPVIIVSGSVGEDAAVRMMKEGADDYVMKGSLTRLPAAAERAIADARARREHRRAEQELRENREWLSAILHSVGEAVIAIDAQGRIRFMNRIAERLAGCSESEALGKEVGQILRFLDSSGEPLDEPPSALALRGDAGCGPRDLLLERGAGDHVAVINTAAPIRNAEGAIIGAALALRDITERKRTEEQLQQTNQELYQFMYSVSHDFQEPLRMITLYTELIRRRLRDLDADTSEYLRYVITGAERMSALLADLRVYTELTRMDAPPDEETDAELVLQKVFINLSAAIEESGAVIVHDPLPVLPVHSAHLTQLFQNLISNSIKYRRSESPAIRIGAARVGEQWKFSFADNGVGIPAQYSERVFEMFKRLHSAEIPGTGMGLAICRRIVQRYGGRIWFQSVPGRGATFYFTLPARKESGVAAV
jgi:PAS domain S-box-containing protein